MIHVFVLKAEPRTLSTLPLRDSRSPNAIFRETKTKQKKQNSVSLVQAQGLISTLTQDHRSQHLTYPPLPVSVTYPFSLLLKTKYLELWGHSSVSKVLDEQAQVDLRSNPQSTPKKLDTSARLLSQCQVVKEDPRGHWTANLAAVEDLKAQKETWSQKSRWIVTKET